jgi:hypothetical protein
MLELWTGETGEPIAGVVTVAGAAYDLTGVAGVRLRVRPDLAANMVVDAAAQIVDAATGSVSYLPQAADVATAGFFIGWWHVTLQNGNTVDSDEFVLLIREHGSLIELCTVADVKALIGEETDTFDGEIADAIEAVSAAFLRRAQRELVPFTPNPQTRVFDIDEDVVCDRSLLVGDLASFTAIAIIAPDGTLLQDVDLATVVAQPRIREAWAPIGELEFRSGAFIANPAILRRGDTAEITGNFGFPQVPSDVRREVKKAAAAQIVRDVKNVSRTLREAAPGFKAASGSMHELPLSAEQCASSYRVPTC